MFPDDYRPLGLQSLDEIPPGSLIKVAYFSRHPPPETITRLILRHADNELFHAPLDEPFLVLRCVKDTHGMSFLHLLSTAEGPVCLTVFFTHTELCPVYKLVSKSHAH